jgi:hypothetical protein
VNFRPWAIAYFEQFFANYLGSPSFWGTFFKGKSDVLILTKNWLGYILGGFGKLFR